MKKKLQNSITCDQANLFGKTIGQLQKEEMLKGDIENLESELLSIDHLRGCERCMIEVTLSIERYFGRTLPWYLNLVNDVSYCEFNEACPKPENFALGSYGNDCLTGTKDFINARLAWAEKIITKELEDRQNDLEQTSKVRGW